MHSHSHTLYFNLSKHLSPLLQLLIRAEEFVISDGFNTKLRIILCFSFIFQN